MKIDELSVRKILLVNVIVIVCLFVFVPLILDLVADSYRVLLISYLGTILIGFLIGLLIIDIFLLALKKQNYYLFSLLNLSITALLFILMMYSFLNNIYEIVYVMNYSDVSLALVYKIVAIWAGEEGSIMTWMLFNSIMISLYRLNNQNKEDLVFIRSVIITLFISATFLIVLYFQNPFIVNTPPLFPNGAGLNPLLISPFMIWHPFFTFIAYAVFLIPFAIIVVETIKRDSKLLNSYQQRFHDFSLKFGWLVLTLSIGLGAYWAKIALNWGRYWGWDPVETVSLVPWFFITAFFHTKIFQKKNPLLIKINVGLVFSSVLFSTLITRGGGLNSLHAFTGGAELVIWVVILGAFLISFTLYVIYIVLDYLMEEYKKQKLLYDYLSYLFLFGLAFVCIFGLFIPPFTHFLSNYFPIDIIFIGTDYFILTSLILAVGLALSLIFCSLWEYFKIKWIGLGLIICLLVQSALSYVLLVILNIWIHPVIIIFIISILASFFKMIMNFTLKKGIKYFFRLNSKTIIHTGISFILAGFLITSIYQDVTFITGFILLLIGIVPSILIAFFPKKEAT
ncbi:MAG: cytochrome c biogenesis protein CcsA [Promethearchaeota archaeon]|jgi:cytochrome c-type biogenesis protein CcmF